MFQAASGRHRSSAKLMHAGTTPGLAAILCLVGHCVNAEACGTVPDFAGLTEGRQLIHVAPDGDDRWSGRSATPSADGRDGPVGSLSSARDHARESGANAAIVVHGMDYFMSDPVDLGPEDAGLTIVSAPGDRPAFHGGLPITGWTDDGGGVWSAPLDRPLAAFYVGGEPQIMARHPNLPANPTPRDGWLFATKPPDGVATNATFGFHPGDIPPIKDVTGLVVMIVGGLYPDTQWGSDTMPVEAIDRTAHLVHMTGTDYFFTGEGSRYFLMGRGEFLDAPGEWWFDQEARRLHYRPQEDQAPDAIATPGVLGTFLRLTGASDVTIAGLGFRDGIIEGTGKYWTNTRGFGAIRVENADRVRLLGNCFRHVGVGIHVSESDNVEIRGNDIADIAGNGIYLGTAWGSFGHSDDAVIEGNRIRRVGQVYFESAGIWLQATDRFRIAGNLIEDTAQFGIAAGSLWGEVDASYDGVIAKNVVRNANQQTADGGAIKLMGAQGDRQRIAVRDNLVAGTDALMNHSDGSFWPPRHEDVLEWPDPISWAIYLDGRASGNIITGNRLVGNVTAIGINGGWANEVTGNVVRDGAGSAVRIDDATGRGWRPDWAAPNRVEGNSFDIVRPDGRAIDINVPDHGMDFVRFDCNRYSGNLTAQTFRVAPQMTRKLDPFGPFSAFQSAGQETCGSIAESVPPVLP